jgi:hypothetical protein
MYSSLSSRLIVTGACPNGEHDRNRAFVQARDEMLTLRGATETKAATPAREAAGRIRIATFEC